MDKAASIQHWLFERRTDAQVISRMKWVVEAIRKSQDREMINGYLKIIKENYGYYDEIFVLDKEGDLIMGTNRDAMNTNHKDYDYFNAAIDGNPMMTDIRISGIARKPTMFISNPIEGQNHQIIGVLVERIRLDLISKIMKEIQTGETVESYLLNKDGFFITESKFEENAVLKARVLTEGYFNCKKEKKGVGEYLDYRGKPVLGSYLCIPEREWCLLVEQDVSEAFYHISILRRTTLAITTIIVILVIIFSVVVSQRTVNTLKRRDREIEEQTNELLRAEKLAAAGRLAAGIAHEIGNPLAGIINCAKLIQSDLQMKDAKILKYLTSIQREAERCNKTLRNFLSFTRETELRFEDVDVNVILEEALELIAHQASSQNVHITKVMDDLRPMLGDKVQLKQAFTNIFLNSLAAMPGGGDLKIETRQKGDFIEIAVSDTGIGIDEKVLSKIFEPFFTTKREGTGLGLAIVYKVIDKHDGRIEVTSSKGEGTEFRIRFSIWKTRGCEK
jgi:two-component system NtrC family sensor kinase